MLRGRGMGKGNGGGEDGYDGGDDGGGGELKELKERSMLPALVHCGGRSAAERSYVWFAALNLSSWFGFGGVRHPCN